ncbi:MAG: hypothetical protein JWO97_1865 [Acidobacteria bacterium]|nr:hypothetical protein [Acidobacteriota bacterium]
MPSNNNPLTVNVTITPTAITVDQPGLAASQGNTPIFWAVATGSTSGAAITNVWFSGTPAWPNPQPTSIGGGKWKVSDNNTNPGPNPISYKYNISATTPNGNPPDLDPTVDNQPPPTGGGGDEGGEDKPGKENKQD